jgi:hypothetical protein
MCHTTSFAPVSFADAIDAVVGSAESIHLCGAVVVPEED